MAGPDTYIGSQTYCERLNRIVHVTGQISIRVDRIDHKGGLGITKFLMAGLALHFNQVITWPQFVSISCAEWHNALCPGTGALSHGPSTGSLSPDASLFQRSTHLRARLLIKTRWPQN